MGFFVPTFARAILIGKGCLELRLSGAIVACIAAIEDCRSFPFCNEFIAFFAESVDGLFCHTIFLILQYKNKLNIKAE